MYEELQPEQETKLASPRAGLDLQAIQNFLTVSKYNDAPLFNKNASALKVVTPNLLLLNVIGLGLTHLTFVGHPITWLLLAWTSAIIGMLTLWAGAFFLTGVGESTRPRLQNFRVNAHTYSMTVLGLVWAVLPALTWEIAGISRQVPITATLLLMIFGTVLLSAGMRSVSLNFSTPIFIGFCVPALINPSANSLSIVSTMLAFALIVWKSNRTQNRQFENQYTNVSNLHSSATDLGILLQDFDQHSSDTFWQTNAQGKFCELTGAEALVPNQNSPFPTGTDFIESFQSSDTKDLLASSLNSRQSFQNVDVLRTFDDGTQRWFKLSAKPLSDKLGQFQGFRGIAKDVTIEKTLELQLHRLEKYDSLTDLPNRDQLTALLEQIAQKYDKNDKGIRALLLLDIDEFKWVNDSFGQASGDLLLKKIARRLQNSIGSSNILARIGGDEFAIILNCDTLDAMKKILLEIQATLDKTMDVSGAVIQTSATIGVRVFPRDETKNAPTLLRQAGLALSAAKKQKKGSWKVYVAGMDIEVQANARLEKDLKHALTSNELDVVFQPIFSGKTGKVVSVESLARWEHPLRGKISPDVFIGYAEDRGLIFELGDWILRTALRTGSGLDENIRISVNVSPAQLHSAHLISNIINALAQSGVAPSRLEIEITERIFMGDNSTIMNQLRKLKELGIRIALDDFGTGYSSLSYLSKFPFNKLKIDKSFIDDLETKKDNRAITAATLRLAQDMGITCTAEGIETPFQKDFLIEHGCDELQGYLLGKPMDIEHLLSGPAKKETEETKRAMKFALPKNLKMDWRMRA